MAQYTLENENWRACVNTQGCELVSMVRKEDDREYIWQADPGVWRRHAPVLFPLVGKYRDDTSRYQGREFHMTQHGFARDMEFEVVQTTDTLVEMKLVSCDSTREKYPFEFVLICGYELQENCLKATWRVENSGGETMYFAIGGHPAFVVEGRESLAGCKLCFDAKKDALRYHLINERGLWLPEEYQLRLDESCSVEITEDMFDRDALIVEQGQAHTVTLSDGNMPVVELSFDAPLFGLWSAAGKKVPYVCIEPWYGRTDEADFAGNLGQRTYDNRLEAGQVFAASYEMRFF